MHVQSLARSLMQGLQTLAHNHSCNAGTITAAITPSAHRTGAALRENRDSSLHTVGPHNLGKSSIAAPMHAITGSTL